MLTRPKNDCIMSNKFFWNSFYFAKFKMTVEKLQIEIAFLAKLLRIVEITDINEKIFKIRIIVITYKWINDRKCFKADNSDYV